MTEASGERITNNLLNLLWIGSAVLFFAKLFGLVSWSWTWITAPIWITYGLGAVALALGLVIAAIGWLGSKLTGRGGTND